MGKGKFLLVDTPSYVKDFHIRDDSAGIKNRLTWKAGMTAVCQMALEYPVYEQIREAYEIRKKREPIVQQGCAPHLVMPWI